MSAALLFRCESCGGLNRASAERLAEHPRCGRCQTPINAANPPFDVDDDQLERLVARSPVPVLVDFWAPWCGPCRAVAPHLAELAKRHAGKLLVAKVNTDQHTRTAGALQVRAIPSLAVYVGGRLQTLEAGARMGPQLEALVRPHLT